MVLKEDVVVLLESIDDRLAAAARRVGSIIVLESARRLFRPMLLYDLTE
jgi:hypothetical protein